MRNLVITCLMLAVVVGCKKNSTTPTTTTSATMNVVFPDGHSYSYTNSSSAIDGDVYEYMYEPTGMEETTPINYIVYTAATTATPFQTAAPAYYTYTFNYIANPINNFNQNATLVTPPYFNFSDYEIDSATSDPAFLGSVINIQDTTYAYNKMNITSTFSDTTHTVYSGKIHVDLYPKYYIVGNLPFATPYQPSSPISIDFTITNIGYY